MSISRTRRPGWAALGAIALALCLVAPAAAQPAADDLALAHKVLVLTSTAARTWATGFLETILQGYGVPYTIVAVDDPSAPADWKGFLWERPGAAGRFSAVVMAPDVEGLGYFTQKQVDDIRDYCRQSGVRAAKFGAEPEALGLFRGACGSDDAILQFTSSTPFGISGVRPDAQLPAAGLSRCTALDGSGPTDCCARLKGASDPYCTPCSTAPILRVAPKAPPAGARKAASGGQQAGALVNHDDGRQAVAFMADCSINSLACLVLGHVALAWALQNVVPGQRKALLSLHVDDILLATGEFGNTAAAYRTTPADLQSTLGWQQQLALRLPPGSAIKAELVFNGNGVLSQINSPDQLLNTPGCASTKLYTDLACACGTPRLAATCPANSPLFCRQCVRDWRRPRGAPGVDFLPPPDTSRWSADAFAKGDPLFALIKSDRRIVDGYFWSTHTFSHQDLDNATMAAARLELDLNAKMASDAFLGLASSTSFSPSSMVPPGITGLFNGDALAALSAFGINTVVGDNTLPGLQNTTNPYSLLYSTEASNGFPTATDSSPPLAIMPRWSTGIGFQASTLQEALEQYNAGNPTAPVASFDALLKAEATRVTGREGLLALRHDPHMFHQANMRTVGSGGTGSLLMLWTEAVLTLFSSLVSWPVRSAKLDDLAFLFRQRQAREDCRLAYRLTVSRRPGVGVTSVGVISGKAPDGSACVAPLLVRDGVDLVDSKGVKATASQLDGVRTLLLRVPAGGAAQLQVAPGGAALTWVAPRTRRRRRQRRRMLEGG